MTSLAPQRAGRSRVRSVDALRGFVMILMALDHVRDFFHVGAMSFQPDDLTRTTAALFFTRWVTHICAPVFMFTAGIGAYFWWQSRGERTMGQLSRFLWARGLWLIVLELTVLRFAMFFSLTNAPLLLTVLWALGLSMIVLGFLVWIPVRWLAPLSAAVVVLHNLADGVRGGSVWNLLHQPGLVAAKPVLVIVAYPLVPWAAVMALGFCSGRVMEWPEAIRRTWMARSGIGLVAAFAVLRAVRGYGDPVPWDGHRVLSFFRITKYPPSLEFLLVTLGLALLLLAWLDGRPWRNDRNPLLVFGRVPLFYFLGHFLLAHLLAFPIAWWLYGRVSFLWNPTPSLGGAAETYPPGYGLPLWGVYVVWLVVVLVLYPLCRWFAGVKARQRGAWWVGYA